jgi:hypothetical protein
MPRAQLTLQATVLPRISARSADLFGRLADTRAAGMTLLIKFLVSTAGRVARVVAGLALIAVGLLAIGGTAGIIVAVIGVLLVVAGLFDFWLFPPLYGAPLSGPKIRAI